MGLVWLLPSLTTIVFFVAIGLVALLPTRRLFLAGWAPRALLGYLVTVIALGLLAVETRGAGRVAVVLAIGLYLAPFVIPRSVLERLGRIGRPPAPQPPRDVTPRPPLGTGAPR